MLSTNDLGGMSLNDINNQYVKQVESARVVSYRDTIQGLFDNTLNSYLAIDLHSKKVDLVNKNDLQVALRKECKKYKVDETGLAEFVSNISDAQLNCFTDVKKASQFYLISYKLTQIRDPYQDANQSLKDIYRFSEWLNGYARAEQFEPPRLIGTNRTGERIRTLDAEVSRFLTTTYTVKQQKQDNTRVERNFVFGLRSAINIIFKTYNPTLFDQFTHYDKNLLLEKNTDYTLGNAEQVKRNLEKDLKMAQAQLADADAIKREATRKYEEYESRRGTFYESSLFRSAYDFEREISLSIQTRINETQTKLKKMDEVIQLLRTIETTKEQFLTSLNQNQLNLITQLLPIIGRTSEINSANEYIKIMQDFLKNGLPLILTEMENTRGSENITLPMIGDLQRLILELSYKIANDELEENELGQKNMLAPILQFENAASAPASTPEEYERWMDEISENRETELLSSASAPKLSSEEYAKLIDEISELREAQLITHASAPAITEAETELLNDPSVSAVAKEEYKETLPTGGTEISTQESSKKAVGEVLPNAGGAIETYSGNYADYVESSSIGTSGMGNTIMSGQYDDYLLQSKKDGSSAPPAVNELSGQYDAFLEPEAPPQAKPPVNTQASEIINNASPELQAKTKLAETKLSQTKLSHSHVGLFDKQSPSLKSDPNKQGIVSTAKSSDKKEITNDSEPSPEKKKLLEKMSEINTPADDPQTKRDQGTKVRSRTRLPG